MSTIANLVTLGGGLFITGAVLRALWRHWKMEREIRRLEQTKARLREQIRNDFEHWRR